MSTSELFRDIKIDEKNSRVVWKIPLTIEEFVNNYPGPQYLVLSLNGYIIIGMTNNDQIFLGKEKSGSYFSIYVCFDENFETVLYDDDKRDGFCGLNLYSNYCKGSFKNWKINIEVTPNNNDKSKNSMLYSSLDRRSFSGVICEIDFKQYYLHKFVLASYFKYFEKLFTGSFSDSKERKIQLTECSIDVFDILIKHMYTGFIDYGNRYSVY